MSIADKLTKLSTDITSAYSAINTKGGTIPSHKNTENLNSAILSIPTGSIEIDDAKDVKLFDYDGTVLYTYTKAEFLTLTDYPDGPTHDGLTSQGWNYDFEEAQDYVNTYGKLNIGSMYTPTDGKTKIYIHLEAGRLSPYLGFAVNGEVTVDWGDNTTSTVTGTSTSTPIYTQHNYSDSGDYVISLDSEDDIYILGDSSGTYLLTKNSATTNENIVYQDAIKKLILGNNIILSNYVLSMLYSLDSVILPYELTTLPASCFNRCYGLRHINVPNNVTTINASCFDYCHSLLRAVLPDSLTSTGSFYLRNCYSLKEIFLPTSLSSINASIFPNDYGLSYVIVPSNIDTIGGAAFHTCSGVKYYDFTHHISVPTLANTNVFTNIADDCQIIVPDDLYNTWIGETNWSTYEDYIVKASEV